MKNWRFQEWKNCNPRTAKPKQFLVQIQNFFSQKKYQKFCFHFCQNSEKAHTNLGYFHLFSWFHSKNQNLLYKSILSSSPATETAASSDKSFRLTQRSLNTLWGKTERRKHLLQTHQCFSICPWPFDTAVKEGSGRHRLPLVLFYTKANFPKFVTSTDTELF